MWRREEEKERKRTSGKGRGKGGLQYVYQGFVAAPNWSTEYKETMDEFINKRQLFNVTYWVFIKAVGSLELVIPLTGVSCHLLYQLLQHLQCV